MKRKNKMKEEEEKEKEHFHKTQVAKSRLKDRLHYGQEPNSSKVDVIWMLFSC